MQKLLSLRWILLIAIMLIPITGVSALPDALQDGDENPTEFIVYHSARNGNTDVYLLNLDTLEETRVTFYPGIDRYAEISPDGTQIVFESERVDRFDRFVLFILDLATGELTQLDIPGDSYAGTWSPDGSQIAYYAHDEREVYQLFVYDLATQQSTQITTGTINHYVPGWRGDGNALVSIANESNISRFTAESDITRFSNIHVTDISTGISEQVLDTPDWDSRVSYSPNDRYILHVSGPYASDDVFVFDTVTENSYRWMDSVDLNTDPAWSPDGKYIIFVSNRAGEETDLYIMDRGGNNVRLLYADAGEISEPMWSYVTVQLADFGSVADF